MIVLFGCFIISVCITPLPFSTQDLQQEKDEQGREQESQEVVTNLEGIAVDASFGKCKEATDADNDRNDLPQHGTIGGNQFFTHMLVCELLNDVALYYV